jgi:O-antigen ligase
MNTAIAWLLASFPLLLVILVVFACILYAIVTLSKPRLLAYPYLAVLLTAPSSSFGRLDEATVSIFSRGSGVLYFPLILWLVLGAYLWSRFSAAFTRSQALPCTLYPWFLGWVFLLLAHCAVALFFQVPIKEAISPLGFSNVVWMASLILLLLSVFRTPAEIEELTRVILLVGLGLAVFGIVRWAAFGGDPSNVYANHEKMDLKLTFFHLNENLVCMLAFCIAAVKLFRADSRRESNWWRAIYWLTIVITTLCIILSFRRSIWLGFLLGGVVILSQLPVKRRIQAALLAGPVVAGGIMYSALKRLSQIKGGGGLESFFFDVQSKDVGTESARLLELKLAWADYVSSPLLGIGAWGRFAGHQLISWQTGDAAGGFVHSGILHIALKTGLIGLFLFIGLYASYFLFVRYAVRNTAEPYQPLLIAGIVGTAFMLPDMLIGTPVPQVKTMQMLALCFALPYLAHGISQRFASAEAARVLTPRSRSPFRTYPASAAGAARGFPTHHETAR